MRIVSVVICAERRINFKSTAIFVDVVKITNSILDVLLESRIDDSWNVDGQLLWTSFTQFTKKHLQMNTRGPERG